MPRKPEWNLLKTIHSGIRGKILVSCFLPSPNRENVHSTSKNQPSVSTKFLSVSHFIIFKEFNLRPILSHQT
jgi:hypothetical protein